MKRMEGLLERFKIKALLKKQKILLEMFSFQPYMWDNPIRINNNYNNRRSNNNKIN